MPPNEKFSSEEVYFSLVAALYHPLSIAIENRAVSIRGVKLLYCLHQSCSSMYTVWQECKTLSLILPEPAKQRLYRNKIKTVEAAYGTGAWVLHKYTKLLSRQGPEKTLTISAISTRRKPFASVATAIANDQRIDTWSLAAAHGVCLRTICQILRQDFRVVKNGMLFTRG